MNNKIINFYDQTFGDNDLLMVYNIDNKYVVYLSDYTFQKDNCIYKIAIGKKGNFGQFFRIKIGNQNSGADNGFIEQIKFLP